MGGVYKSDENLEDYIDGRSLNGTSSGGFKMASSDPILPAAGDRESTLLTAAASVFILLNAGFREILWKFVDIIGLLKRFDFGTFLFFAEMCLNK